MKSESEKPEDANLSLSGLARFTGLHRQTVKKHLDKAELVPVIEKAKEKRYNLKDAIRAILDRATVETAVDRRNEAQARKLGIESDNLLKKNIPMDEVLRPLTMILTGWNRVLQDCDMPDEAKERVIDLINDSYPDVDY